MKKNKPMPLATIADYPSNILKAIGFDGKKFDGYKDLIDMHSMDMIIAMCCDRDLVMFKYKYGCKIGDIKKIYRDAGFDCTKEDVIMFIDANLDNIRTFLECIKDRDDKYIFNHFGSDSYITNVIKKSIYNIGCKDGRDACKREMEEAEYEKACEEEIEEKNANEPEDLEYIRSAVASAISEINKYYQICDDIEEYKDLYSKGIVDLSGFWDEENSYLFINVTRLRTALIGKIDMKYAEIINNLYKGGYIISGNTPLHSTVIKLYNTKRRFIIFKMSLFPYDLVPQEKSSDSEEGAPINTNESDKPSELNTITTEDLSIPDKCKQGELSLDSVVNEFNHILSTCLVCGSPEEYYKYHPEAIGYRRYDLYFLNADKLRSMIEERGIDYEEALKCMDCYLINADLVITRSSREIHYVVVGRDIITCSVPKASCGCEAMYMDID